MIHFPSFANNNKFTCVVHESRIPFRNVKVFSYIHSMNFPGTQHTYKYTFDMYSFFCLMLMNIMCASIYKHLVDVLQIHLWICSTKHGFTSFHRMYLWIWEHRMWKMALPFFFSFFSFSHFITLRLVIDFIQILYSSKVYIICMYIVYSISIPICNE